MESSRPNVGVEDQLTTSVLVHNSKARSPQQGLCYYWKMPPSKSHRLKGLHKS